MAHEGQEMQQNRQVNLNWATINVPSVASILIVGIGVAMYVQALSSKVEKIEDSRQDRAAVVDKSLDDIHEQLKPLANLPYRVNIVEQQLIQTNQRVDQYLRTLGEKIDGVSDRVNGLSTKVEVLSQKIDALTPEKRASIDQRVTAR
jgi:outer membrane murein-binding lipoprotein Lpp